MQGLVEVERLVVVAEELPQTDGSRAIRGPASETDRLVREQKEEKFNAPCENRTYASPSQGAAAARTLRSFWRAAPIPAECTRDSGGTC